MSLVFLRSSTFILSPDPQSIKVITTFYVRNSGSTESKTSLESVGLLCLDKSTDLLRAYLGWISWEWGSRRRGLWEATNERDPEKGEIIAMGKEGTH